MALSRLTKAVVLRGIREVPPGAEFTPRQIRQIERGLIWMLGGGAAATAGGSILGYFARKAEEKKRRK